MDTTHVDYRSPEYGEMFRKYLDHLRQLPKEEAVREARDGLIRTGVADENGHVKKKIVSWE